jgi:hypothetical protein
MRKVGLTAYGGGMTMGARKRLAKAVTVMTQAIKPRWVHNPVTCRQHFHRFSFITLTIASPKNITARRAYDELLSHFLDWMTRTAAQDDPHAKTYIWKAELQKRGQMHYHITTPAFIHYRDIRAKWNDLQRRAGLLDDYAREHGHFDPNSTDIHETRHVRKADRYLLKELGKSLSALQVEQIAGIKNKVIDGELTDQEGQEQIDHVKKNGAKLDAKIWGCSEDLAGVNYYTLELTRRHEDLIEQWIAEGKAWMKKDDFFAIVYCDNVDPPDLLSGKEQIKFSEYLTFAMSRKSSPINLN